MEALTMQDPPRDRGTVPSAAQAAAPDAASDAATEAVADAVSGPLRRCIATRTVAPRHTLLRLVVGPDGALVPDIEGKLPGRGLWITPRRAVIEEARRRFLFAKAARRPVTVPEDLAARIEAGLARRCIELLGLARRAGQAVAGFEKVRAQIGKGRVGLLVEASDGAPDGRRKLAALAAGIAGEAGTPPHTMAALSAAELAAALGRETAVHVAIAPGRLAARLQAEAARLQEMRVEAGQELTAGNAAGGAKKNDRNGK